MSDISIRSAKPEDWPILQKLNAEVFANDRNSDKHLNVSYPYTKEGIAYYQSVCSDPEYGTFIAFEGDTPLGYAVTSPKKMAHRTNKALEIENIGVTTTRRSQGIGSLLLNHIKVWAKEKGYTHLFVNAYCQNTRVHHFYQKHGLTPIDMSFEGKL